MSTTSIRILPDPHPSEGIAEGDQVLAPPGPLSQLDANDLIFWLPAMKSYRDTQLGLIEAQRVANAAIDSLNFLASVLREKYQMTLEDQIDEEGKIIRKS